MSDLAQIRRWQADEYEKKNSPRLGELNIPQILRDDADEIERLKQIERSYIALHAISGQQSEDIKHLRKHLDACSDTCGFQARQIAKLQAVVDAAKDIKWRSIDKDNMEFATTCFVVDRIREALAALDTVDHDS